MPCPLFVGFRGGHALLAIYILLNQKNSFFNHTAMILPSLQHLTSSKPFTGCYSYTNLRRVPNSTSGKSFIVTRSLVDSSPFPVSRSPQRYLGFHISPSGTLILPPNPEDEWGSITTNQKAFPITSWSHVHPFQLHKAEVILQAGCHQQSPG